MVFASIRGRTAARARAWNYDDRYRHFLESEEVRHLLDAAEHAGSIRAGEVLDLIELFDLDAYDIDGLYRELEQRGIEVTEDEAEVAAPVNPAAALSYETTTDALQLFLREAGRHPLLTAARRSSWPSESSAATDVRSRE